jgi:dTDP-4-dehydrorhamnose reductase
VSCSGAVAVRVLVLGGAGMLGHKVWQIFRQRFDTWVTLRSSLAEYSALGLFEAGRTVSGVDAMNLDTLLNAWAVVRPHVVVNCIGVVKQLPSARDPVLSVGVNALFPHRVATLCRSSGARLIHVSTDCVFSGSKGQYVESDAPDAQDLYGRTKAIGEPHETDPVALTLRTSIIGRELRTTTGLTEWFLSQRGGTVPGFMNAIFSGLTTETLAHLIAETIERQRDLRGLYHVGSSAIRKHDLLVRLNEAFAAGVIVRPSHGESIDRSLDSSRFWQATGFQQPAWDAMIASMTADPTPYDEWRGNNYVS